MLLQGINEAESLHIESSDTSTAVCTRKLHIVQDHCNIKQESLY
jgi:hypothetical protein